MPDDQPIVEHGRNGGQNPPRDADRPQPENLKEEDRERRSSEAGRGRDGDKVRNGKRRSIWPRLILIAAIIIAVIAAATYWFLTRNLESTNDAYTDGHAVTIAPHVSGYVVALKVRDNQFVHKGDVLVEIDPSTYIAARDQAVGNAESVHGQLVSAKYAAEIARKNFPAALDQAKAQLATAQANLFKAQADYKRQKSLPRPATTQQAVDDATAALHQAEAQVQQAEAQVEAATPVPQNIGEADARVEQLDGLLKQANAQVDQAKLNLSWTKVTAPQDGWVTKRNVEVGNYVQAGAAIMSLVTPDVWVTANFKETQLDRMRPGQKVDISVDAYPQLKLKGHIDSVQMGSGAQFSAFPPENATGNFVKIVRRVPVKIVIDSGLDPKLPLPYGISVEPTVHLK